MLGPPSPSQSLRDESHQKWPIPIMLWVLVSVKTEDDDVRKSSSDFLVQTSHPQWFDRWPPSSPTTTTTLEVGQDHSCHHPNIQTWCHQTKAAPRLSQQPSLPSRRKEEGGWGLWREGGRGRRRKCCLDFDNQPTEPLNLSSGDLGRAE